MEREIPTLKLSGLPSREAGEYAVPKVGIVIVTEEDVKAMMWFGDAQLTLADVTLSYELTPRYRILEAIPL